jgi:hypothetical protein
MSMGNIVGDPFALATISISMVCRAMPRCLLLHIQN